MAWAHYHSVLSGALPVCGPRSLLDSLLPRREEIPFATGGGIRRKSLDREDSLPQCLIAQAQDTRVDAGYMYQRDKAKLELGRRTVQLEQRGSNGACPRKALAFKFPARF